MSISMRTGIGRAPLRDHRDDCYDTPPEAVHPLIRTVCLPPVIWEPACGTGNIVKVLRSIPSSGRRPNELARAPTD